MSVTAYQLLAGEWVPLGTLPPPTPQTELWVGAEAAVPVDGTSETRGQTVTRVAAELGPLAVLRCYSGPNDRPAAWGDVAEAAMIDQLGLAPFWSTAAAYTLQTSDDPGYVTWLRSFIATLPTDRPVWVTTHHEPENDGVPGATFVDAYRRFYDHVKAVRPDILVGPCYMAYQWANGRGVDTGGGPAAWDPGPAHMDFVGMDNYCMQGVPLARLQDDTRHMRWHNHFTGYGLPLYVVERGLDHTYKTGTPSPDDGRIAQIILDDEAWMRRNGYQMLLWWQAKGGIVELTDTLTPLALAAYRGTASRGRTT